MLRKFGIPVLALALVLALAPAATAAVGAPVTTDGGGASLGLKYVACAGSILFCVAVQAAIFYTAVVCAHAFIDQ